MVLLAALAVVGNRHADGEKTPISASPLQGICRATCATHFCSSSLPWRERWPERSEGQRGGRPHWLAPSPLGPGPRASPAEGRGRRNSEAQPVGPLAQPDTQGEDACSERPAR